MASKCWRWLAAALLLGVAAAQAPSVPVVPTDHYGPPACSPGAKPAAAGPTPTERAVAEQHEGAGDASAIPSAEPMENFALGRYRLTDYGECRGSGGCYWADLDAQYKRAEAALAVELGAHKRGEKLALVMDIDETTLTNYCEMKREDFGYISKLYSEWETGTESATAIPGALRLFHEAKAAGVAVFFITGRPGVPDYAAATHGVDETAGTARNLEAAGFHGWTGLALRNGTEISMATIDYKSEERHRIVEQGYTIVLSVGDQWSDLLGEPKADTSVKLPNPFYFIS